MLFKQDYHGYHSSSKETCQAAGSLWSVCANIQLSVMYKIVPQLEAVLNAPKDLVMLTCSTGTLQTCVHYLVVYYTPAASILRQVQMMLCVLTHHTYLLCDVLLLWTLITANFVLADCLSIHLQLQVALRAGSAI